MSFSNVFSVWVIVPPGLSSPFLDRDSTQYRRGFHCLGLCCCIITIKNNNFKNTVAPYALLAVIRPMDFIPLPTQVSGGTQASEKVGHIEAKAMAILDICNICFSLDPRGEQMAVSSQSLLQCLIVQMKRPHSSLSPNGENGVPICHVEKPAGCKKNVPVAQECEVTTIGPPQRIDTCRDNNKEDCCHGGSTIRPPRVMIHNTDIHRQSSSRFTQAMNQVHQPCLPMEKYCTITISHEGP